MLKKTVMGLALVAAVALLVPQDVLSREADAADHGGGFPWRWWLPRRRWRYAARGFAAGARACSGGGARFYGGEGRGYTGNVARWKGGKLE